LFSVLVTYICLSTCVVCDQIIISGPCLVALIICGKLCESEISALYNVLNGKGKQVLLQAWSGPEGSRKLKLRPITGLLYLFLCTQCDHIVLDLISFSTITTMIFWSVLTNISFLGKE